MTTDPQSPLYTKRSFVRTSVESYRALVLAKAVSDGMSRKRAEAGFTHDVCAELETIGKRYKEEDLACAYSLCTWVIKEWPSSRTGALVPPEKLGKAALECMRGFKPDKLVRGGDNEGNSAGLIPEGLRGIVMQMDEIENYGCK